jgi:hypothetical protein
MADNPEDIIKKISKFHKKGSSREWKLIYNSPFETLEPVYFWILDFMGYPKNVDKIVDNFASSPGSGHFSELMMKATRMQEEAMKIYGMINTVIKSIQNLIYDLKEFQLRLAIYNDAKSKDKNIASAGLISLKQIWMDQVDIKKGVGSINMLSRDLNFVTIRDAFMVTDSLEKVEELDLNDRVKRILKARVQEFIEWKERSETELRKRFEVEKTYLKTQVNTIKLYSRWVKPYLIAAKQLEQGGISNASLVTAFNTINIGVTLMKKEEVDVQKETYAKNLPKNFLDLKNVRKYYSCSVVDFKFRGIPQKMEQHYTFGGRVDVSFRAYALNEEELALFKKKLEDSDLDDAMKTIIGATDESLGQIKEDIDYFLEDDREKEEEKENEEREKNDVNPFTALLGLDKLKIFQKKEKKNSEKEEEEEVKKLEKEGIKKDTYAESVIRKLAETNAVDFCYKIYDIYKKAHGMASTQNMV